MQKVYDKDGNVVRRVVKTNFTANAHTEITQVPGPNGTWNNIKTERVGHRNSYKVASCGFCGAYGYESHTDACMDSRS